MRKFESRLVSMAATAIILLSTLASNTAFTSYPARHQASQGTTTNHRSARKSVEERIEDDGDSTTAGSGGGPVNSTPSSSRRLFVSQATAASAAVAVGALLSVPRKALAGIDVSSLKNLPLENDASGSATRLKILQSQGTRVEREESSRSSLFSEEDPYSLPFTRLQGDVSYRDVKVGREGGRKVQKGSLVGVEMSIRCKSLPTAEEPAGLKYFSTQDDTNYNELVWKIGSGDFVRGAEEGMMGMKLNGVRLIEVPSQQIFAARNAGVLPEAKTEEGKRIYENAFKTDATLVFEVFVTAINQGDNRI